MGTPKRIQCASGSNPDLAGDLDGCLAFHSEVAMQLNRIVSAHMVDYMVRWSAGDRPADVPTWVRPDSLALEC
jgi:hypothetical protein